MIITWKTNALKSRHFEDILLSLSEEFKTFKSAYSKKLKYS